jgi:hypothetical protein
MYNQTVDALTGLLHGRIVEPITGMYSVNCNDGTGDWEESPWVCATGNYAYTSKNIFPNGTSLFQSTTAIQTAYQRWSENDTNGIKKVYRRWVP